MRTGLAVRQRAEASESGGRFPCSAFYRTASSSGRTGPRIHPRHPWLRVLRERRGRCPCLDRNRARVSNLLGRVEKSVGVFWERQNGWIRGAYLLPLRPGSPGQKTMRMLVFTASPKKVFWAFGLNVPAIMTIPW